MIEHTQTAVLSVLSTVGLSSVKYYKITSELHCISNTLTLPPRDTIVAMGKQMRLNLIFSGGNISTFFLTASRQLDKVNQVYTTNTIAGAATGGLAAVHVIADTLRPLTKPKVIAYFLQAYKNEVCLHLGSAARYHMALHWICG